MPKDRQLIIIGAGGFGREVLFLAQRLGINIKGFLADTPALQGTSVDNIPVIGTIDQWTEHTDATFVVAIGSPKGRQAVIAKMNQLGTPKFTTLVDPSAIIGKKVDIEAGSIICAGVICTTNIKIGKNVILNLNTTVGHDTQIGDYCTLAPGVNISGNTHLCDGVEIGTGASLREKLTLGDGCIVGMGSVVVKDVAAGSVVYGNPAIPR